MYLHIREEFCQVIPYPSKWSFPEELLQFGHSKMHFQLIHRRVGSFIHSFKMHFPCAFCKTDIILGITLNKLKAWWNWNIILFFYNAFHFSKSGRAFLDLLIQARRVSSSSGFLQLWSPPSPFARTLWFYCTILQVFLTSSFIGALLHSPEPTLPLSVFCLNTYKRDVV